MLTSSLRAVSRRLAGGALAAAPPRAAAQSLAARSFSLTRGGAAPTTLLQLPRAKQFSTIPKLALPYEMGPLACNTIRDNMGSRKKRRRVGRGVGSTKGRTCGRGHKGQKAR